VQDVIAAYFCGPSPTCEERNIRDNEEWGVLKTTAATREKGWDWTKHKTLPRVFWNKPQIELKKGDVIVTKAGPRHRVGVTAWIDYVPPRIIPSGKMIALRPNPNKVVPLMLAAAVAARDAQTYLDQRTTGMAESQVNFENVALLETPIHLPPIEEQRAIQTALSDVDGLLGGLDRLIAKKRDLKQAAMQQLLTGQTRLPSFNGKWEVKRLGDVTDTDPENLGSDTRPDFAFNYISLEDVDQGTLRGYSEQVFRTAPSRARRKLRAEDVLVSTVRPNLKSHLLFRSNGQTWICSTGFCVVRCREKQTHPGYVFFHMFGNLVARQIEALLTGSNYPAINSGDVRALEIPVPDFPEQTAIAEVLTEMDLELAGLEQRREKTRSLKQAMMQELLTGRIRLVGRN